MHGEVVHDHDLSGHEALASPLESEDPPHVDPEGDGVQRPLDAHRSPHALPSERGDERDIPVPAPRGFAVRPLAPRRSGVSRGEGGVRRGLVHEDEPFRVHAPHALAESSPFILVPLGGRQRLFLYVQPSFPRIARLIAEMDTETPVFSFHIPQ